MLRRLVITGLSTCTFVEVARDAVNLVIGEPLRLLVHVRSPGMRSSKVTHPTITVKLAGAVVLRASIPGFDPRGRWGVGDPPGSRSSWKGLGIR
jgi:hypothetical protein